MAQGRVQTPDLQGNAALRPAPIQSDTFVTPARPPHDNRLAMLAQSLQSFSGSIGNLASAIPSGPTAEEREKARWIGERRINGMTSSEIRDAVGNGTLPVYSNVFSAQAQMAASGMKYGADEALLLKEDLRKNFDWQSGDADAYITSKMNQFLETNQYAKDPNFGASYVRQMNSVRGWATEYQETAKTQRFVAGQHQAAFDYIDTFVRQQSEGKVDPQQIANNIFAMYPDMGKDGTLGVDYDALDKEVLNVSRQVAGVYPEVALALVGHTRKGRNGTDRSLLSNADARDTVLQIQATARKAMSERDERTMLGRQADQDYEALRTGNLDNLEDLDYTTTDGHSKTLTKADREKAAVNTFLDRSKAIAQGNRENKPQQLARELRSFRLSGIKHPELEKAVGGMADMASVDLIGDPEGMQKLVQKVDAYKWMQHESKNSVMAYTSEKDRDFAEAFIMGQTYGDMNDQAALEFAIHSTQPLTSAGRENLSKFGREIDAEVKNLATSKNWFGFDSDSAPENWSTVRAKVVQLANGFVASGGMEPKRAVEAAAAAVKKNSTSYNGSLLDLQGLDVPPNFSETVDDAIGDYITKNPRIVERNDIDPASISIKTLGSDKSGGRFILIDKETQAPLYTDNKEVVTLSLGQLRAHGRKKEEQQRKDTIRQEVFDNSVQRNKLMRAVEADGNEVWLDGNTREIYDFTYPEDAQGPAWKKTGRRYKRGVIVTPEGFFALKGSSMLDGGESIRKWRAIRQKNQDNMVDSWKQQGEALRQLFPSIKIGGYTVNE